MSGVRVSFSSVQIATTTSLKTLIQIIAAANHRVLLKELNVSFEGIVATDAPIQLRLLRQTTAGTSGTALAGVKLNADDGETLQTTFGSNYSAEPTASDVLRSWLIHPQSRLLYPLPFGREIPIKGGTRLGLDVLAGVSIDCIVSGELEE